MSSQGSSHQDIITQLVNLNLYMLKVRDSINPGEGQAIFGAAMEHTRQYDKIEPKLLLEMFKESFPNSPLPKALPPDEFEALIKQQAGNS